MKHILITIVAVLLVGYVTGIVTGALVSVLMSVVTDIVFFGKNLMSRGWTALLTLIGTPLASVFIISFSIKILLINGKKDLGLAMPRFTQLIPVAFLTLFIPVFGMLMGTPKEVNYLAMIIGGALGGAFWITPFVLWNIIRSVFLLHKQRAKIGEELKAEGK